MFDPTAFDNLKVIVEGAVYDFDLHGDILVTDRKDMMDLASLSRIYHIFISVNRTIRTVSRGNIFTICRCKELVW